MNLHQIASGAIGVINPGQWISHRPSTGYTTGADGTRTPTYGPAQRRFAQVQATRTNDLRKLDGLNIQSETLTAWMSGMADAVERQTAKGGDLFTLSDGSLWLVQSVAEQWPGWVAVLLVRQMP
jgi:hypothetical protein